MHRLIPAALLAALALSACGSSDNAPRESGGSVAAPKAKPQLSTATPHVSALTRTGGILYVTTDLRTAEQARAFCAEHALTRAAIEDAEGGDLASC
jgi:hypothetical protein